MAVLWFGCTNPTSVSETHDSRETILNPSLGHVNSIAFALVIERDPSLVEMMPAIGSLEAITIEGQRGSDLVELRRCTGTFLGPQVPYILTAYHCLAGKLFAEHGVGIRLYHPAFETPLFISHPPTSLFPHTESPNSAEPIVSDCGDVIDVFSAPELDAGLIALPQNPEELGVGNLVQVDFAAGPPALGTSLSVEGSTPEGLPSREVIWSYLRTGSYPKTLSTSAPVHQVHAATVESYAGVWSTLQALQNFLARKSCSARRNQLNAAITHGDSGGALHRADEEGQMVLHGIARQSSIDLLPVDLSRLSADEIAQLERDFPPVYTDAESEFFYTNLSGTIGNQAALVRAIWTRIDDSALYNGMTAQQWVNAQIIAN